MARGAGNGSPNLAAFEPEPTTQLVPRVWQVRVRGEVGQPTLPLLLHVSSL